MVHCHHGSIQQLLGNQLLLGADATTHVLIIAGSLSIFSKNKGIAWQDNLMKPGHKKRIVILPPRTMTSFSIAYSSIWRCHTYVTFICGAAIHSRFSYGIFTSVLFRGLSSFFLTEQVVPVAR